MRTPRLLSGAAIAVAALFGCSSPFTSGSTSSAGSGGGASSGTTTTTSGSAGGHGGGGTGGATSSSGSSGGDGGGGGSVKPCVPGDLSTCKDGEYCSKDTGLCTSCGDLGSFSFTDPKKLGVTAPGNGAATYPRQKGARLVLSFISPMQGDIAGCDAAGMGQWAPPTELASPVNTASDETAPLLLGPSETKAIEGIVLDKNAVKVGQSIVVFDSDRMLPGTPQIYAANPGQPGVSLLNVKGDAAVSHLAVAPDANPYRIWFMSAKTGNINPHLVTANPGSPPAMVNVDLANGCSAVGDVSPWVTTDGKHLLFNSADPDPNNACSGLVDKTRHVYIADVDPASGQQKPGTQAARLLPADPLEQLTPSLSTDACTLYFSRSTGLGTGELYSSVRQ